MIARPIYLQMVLEYNALQAGLSLAPISLSMFAVALLAGRKAGTRRPADIVQLGFLLALGVPILAGLIGFVLSFRMKRLPDPAPSSSAAGLVLG